MTSKSIKILLVFVLAFFLNLIWEVLHSFLYSHYQGGPITRIVLIKASLFDAIFITLIYVLFLKWRYFQKRIWLALLIGFVFAIILEIYALKTGRWAYNSLMPIVPIIGTGLTPTIQLGVLAYLTFKAVQSVKDNTLYKHGK